MSVPFFDLQPQHNDIEEELKEAFDRVLGHGRFILGDEVARFESELATYLGVRHVIGVSSGSDALLSSLMALDVGPGDKVLTTPLSFFATVGCILRLGAQPVFADVREEDFHLNPEHCPCGPVPTCKGAPFKAAIPVHLFGLQGPALRCTAPIIEDSAQAIGAAKLYGLAGCLSFFPTKNLGALGDGGAIYTNDNAFADRLRLFRAHGSRPKYVHQVVGGNFRLDALQAAFLSVKLKHLDRWTAQRRENAARYRQLFAQAKSANEHCVLPKSRPEHTYHQFVIRVSRRDDLRVFLSDKGISTEVYYPLPFHLQPCLASFGYKAGDFPVAERVSQTSLALPIYPGLPESDQTRIVEAIDAFFRDASRP